MSENLIKNVSDTARWVAVYRAWESSRADALFSDRYAAKLAGELGRQLAHKLSRPGGLGNGWPIITRTKIIDDYVHAAVAQGCTCVVNLAAGLDTRPYRMALPSHLRWLEVDLPEILEYKAQVLDGQHPACQLERRPVDLSNHVALGQLLDEVTDGKQRVAVIAEGLLVYLDVATVETLADALRMRPAIDVWITEIASPGIVSRMQRDAGDELSRAPMKFAPAEGIAFFESRGWRVEQGISLFKEGARLKRVPWYLRPFALFPDADPRAPGNRPWSWVMRLKRSRGSSRDHSASQQ